MSFVDDNFWAWEHEIAKVGSEYDIQEGLINTTLPEAIESYKRCCSDKIGSSHYLIIHLTPDFKISHRFTLKEAERLLKLNKL